METKIIRSSVPLLLVVFQSLIENSPVVYSLGHSIQGELCNHCSHWKLEMPSFWRRFNSSQRWRCTQCDFVGQTSEKAKKIESPRNVGPQKNESVKIWGFPEMVGFPNNYWVFRFSYKKWPFWSGDWGYLYHHFRKHPYPSMGSCHMRCLELNHRTAGECANRVKPASIDMEKGFLGCQRAGKKGVSIWDVHQVRCFKRVFWWLFQLSIVSFFDFTALRNAEDSIILWPDTDDESQIDAWPFFDWEKLEELVMPSKTWRPWWSVQILQTKGSARQIEDMLGLGADPIPHILHFNAGQRVTPMSYFSTYFISEFSCENTPALHRILPTFCHQSCTTAVSN